MSDLDEATGERVDILAEEGNALLEGEGDWSGAIACWTDSLALLPEPHTTADEATWLYASIGEAYLVGGDEAAALQSFEMAYRCPDGHVNSFVLLRLGQQMRRQANRDAAVRLLLRAYMLEGEGLFAEAAGDLAFLRAQPEFTAPTV